jgi:hypothetical protein
VSAYCSSMCPHVSFVQVHWSGRMKNAEANLGRGALWSCIKCPHFGTGHGLVIDSDSRVFTALPSFALEATCLMTTRLKPCATAWSSIA